MSGDYDYNMDTDSSGSCRIGHTTTTATWDPAAESFRARERYQQHLAEVEAEERMREWEKKLERLKEDKKPMWCKCSCRSLPHYLSNEFMDGLNDFKGQWLVSSGRCSANEISEIKNNHDRACAENRICNLYY